MAILALLCLAKFLGLDALVDISDVKILWVLHVEVLKHVRPFDAGESWLHLCLVSDYHVRFRIFTML